MCLLTIWALKLKTGCRKSETAGKMSIPENISVDKSLLFWENKTGGNLSINHGYAYNLVEVLFTDLTVGENITVLADVTV